MPWFSSKLLRGLSYIFCILLPGPFLVLNSLVSGEKGTEDAQPGPVSPLLSTSSSPDSVSPQLSSRDVKLGVKCLWRLFSFEGKRKTKPFLTKNTKISFCVSVEDFTFLVWLLKNTLTWKGNAGRNKGTLPSFLTAGTCSSIRSVLFLCHSLCIKWD